jgi:hypothetical protein
MARLTDVAAKIETRTTAKLARSSVVLELPLYDGQYAGRFGLLPDETQREFERLAERAQADELEPAEAINAAADMIADSCRRILARSEPGGPYEPLEHDDGRPVKFDEDFAKLLGLRLPDEQPIGSMADVVRACWTVEDDAGDEGTLEVNTTALQGFAIRLLRFMQDTRAPVEGEVVGEAVGGRK